MPDLASPSAGFAITDDVIAASLRRIYANHSGASLRQLDPALFKATAGSIRHAVATGVSNAISDGVPAPNRGFLHQLGHSADVFSAFKTHNQQKELVGLLTNDKGKLRSFSDFRKASTPIIGKYNKNWLRTEYNTAVSRAHHAANWQQYEAEKDVMPCLEWIESTSPNPGEDHSIFWGTIQPVDAPFWDEHRPGDRWNCQCSLEQTDKEPTVAPQADSASAPHPGLDSNPGTDGKLFNESHPYYPKSCTSCPFASNKLMALYHDLADDRDCHNCKSIDKEINKTTDVSKNDTKVANDISNALDGIVKNGYGKGEIIDAGELPKKAVSYCTKNKIPVGDDGLKILDSRLVHMQRDAKVGRGAALDKEDIINMVQNMRNADMYFDKSHKNLLFVCSAASGKDLIKYAVAPSYKYKGKSFATVLTAGKMKLDDIATSNYIKIK